MYLVSRLWEVEVEALSAVSHCAGLVGGFHNALDETI